MMNEAINDGRGKDIIVIQDFPPISEGSVGGNHHGATFIPVGDDLKQKFCPLLVHREIAQLINDKQLGGGKRLHGSKEGVI